MEKSEKEVISGTQTEVYPPLLRSWGEDRVTTSRTCSQSFLPAPCLAHTARLGSSLHPHQDLEHRVTKHRRDSEVRQFRKNHCRTKPPKSRPATQKQTPLNPKATFPRAPQRALGNKPSLFAPRVFLQPPLGSRATELSPRHPPRGWEPVSPTAALGKFPAKLSRRSPLLTLRRERAGGRAASRAPRRAQPWRAGNSSVIISAERLLPWIVYIL